METANLEAATCFPFLQLPREIRNQIYSILLDSEAVPLLNPELLTTPPQGVNINIRDWPVFIYDPESYQAHHPAKLPEIGSIACQGLRLTNHQVLAEVSDAVMIANPHGGTYKLDIMVLDSLCLSWIALPTPLPGLRDLVLDLRIYTQLGWNGVGGPGPHFQSLLRLLTTFLRTGPSFSENQSLLPDLKVDSLTVNVVDYVDSESFRPGDYHTSQRIWVWLRMVALSGVLFGRVGVVRFHAKNKQDEWVMEDKGDTSRLTAEWKPYGWTL
ncbi:hypothetical protein MMC15_000596 [Xylographa vitiligo]|nr:hypothetical protein [Xylographa vitiligo]